MVQIALLGRTWSDQVCLALQSPCSLQADHVLILLTDPSTLPAGSKQDQHFLVQFCLNKTNLLACSSVADSPNSPVFHGNSS